MFLFFPYTLKNTFNTHTDTCMHFTSGWFTPQMFKVLPLLLLFFFLLCSFSFYLVSDNKKDEMKSTIKAVSHKA